MILKFNLAFIVMFSLSYLYHRGRITFIKNRFSLNAIYHFSRLLIHRIIFLAAFLHYFQFTA